MRVVGTGGSTFRGFLVQARAPSNAPPAAPMLLGSFQTGAGSQRVLDCDAVGASTVGQLKLFVISSIIHWTLCSLLYNII